MAKGVINLQKESGGVTKITSTDGATNTDVVLPESGNLVSVDTAVTDNAIARYDGTTGKLQNSGVVIDDNGNVGVGVVPSASGSSTHGIQTEYNYMGALGGGGQIMYNAVPSSNVDSAYLYSSIPAETYEQNASGQHIWKTAPAGTAGNPIPWTNAMTLGANGNLLVGTSVDNGVDKLQVNGSISSGSVMIVSDLNNITSAGGGFLTGDFTFSMVANRPCDYGTLHQIARGPAECTQMVQDMLSNSLFVRRYVGSAWTAWVEK